MGPSIVASMGTRRTPPPREAWIFLAEWRDFRGFTQQKLGDDLGVDKATISRYESGKRRPPINHIFALATALGITPMALFRSPSVPSLDDIADGLSEDDRRRVREFAEALRRTNDKPQ